MITIHFKIQCLAPNFKLYLVNETIFLIKYNVHIPITSFILLMHLSEQGEYTYYVFAANIKFSLVNAIMFNEMQCSFPNNTFLPC